MASAVLASNPVGCSLSAEPPAVEQALGVSTQQLEQPSRTSCKRRGSILELAICASSVLRFPGLALTQLMSMSTAHLPPHMCVDQTASAASSELSISAGMQRLCTAFQGLVCFRFN